MKYAALVILLCFSALAPAHAAVNVQEVTSPGGIKAWLVQDNKLPLIAMQFAFRGGVEQDPVAKQGLSELATSLLTEGAGSYDAEAFQQKLADNAIKLEIQAGRDSLDGGLKTLKSTQKTAFDLLRLALTKPRFDTAAIERARSQQLTGIRFELGDRSWQGRHALFAHLFGEHSYALRHLGTVKTLASLTRDDIADFVTHRLAQDNLVVAVTGDISPQELGSVLDNVFGALPKQAQLTTVPDVAWPDHAMEIAVPREGTQTSMLFTMPMMHRDDPDWYAAEIANYILGGGGFSSLLMKEIRDNNGLTYGISTTLVAMDHAWLLLGQTDTDNAKTGRAWDLVQKAWQDFYQNGANEVQIKAAKDYLTGSLPLKLTSTQAIASVLVDMQLKNLGRDYLDRRSALIRNVSADDVNRVIKKWFNPDALTLVAVGAPEGLKPTETQEQTRD